MQMRPFHSLQEAIDGVGQMAVFVGDDPTRIVGVQLNAHIAVLIVKGGVVGMLFGQKSHTGHKRECFLEVLKPKFPAPGGCPSRATYFELYSVKVARRAGN